MRKRNCALSIIINDGLKPELLKKPTKKVTIKFITIIGKNGFLSLILTFPSITPQANPDNNKPENNNKS